MRKYPPTRRLMPDALEEGVGPSLVRKRAIGPGVLRRAADDRASASSGEDEV